MALSFPLTPTVGDIHTAGALSWRWDGVKWVSDGGASSGGGNVSYTHTQSIAAAVWTAPHNLGRWPSVSVVDHLGNRVEPDVSYVDQNIVQITHGQPFIGKAFFN